MRCQTPTFARPIATLMGFEAATLAVMSSLHLTGIVGGDSKPSDPSGAGIAEAVICLALAGGAVALIYDRPNARAIAVAATAFAILGFIIGLSFTLRAGEPVDIAYHATVLPLLVLTLALLRPTPLPRHA